MNMSVSVEPQQLSSQIAQIVFSMFVYVADVERDITAQEVRRFQTLLKENAWTENADLLKALDDLKEKYSTFWSTYEDGQVPVTHAAIESALTQVGLVLGEERDRKLRRDLYNFLERLEGSVYGVKLLSGEQKAKAAARKELVKIVGHENNPSAPPRKVMSAASLPEAIPAPSAPAAAIAPPAPSKAAAPVTSSRIWQSGKTRVRCVSIVEETHDTKTYYFAAEPQILFNYKPGQFVTIEIALAAQVLRRSYTISSSPSRPYLLSITVKKVPMGWMSNWLYDNMVEGMECTLSGPAGKFTCADHTGSQLLFLAAGSGVTPCMSMLRWLADMPTTTDIVFINSVRTPRDIIFHQELLYLSARMGSRLRLAILPSALSAGQPWQGPVGRLDEAFLRSFVPGLLKREVFACGPSGFMEGAKSMLSAMGFPLKHYHHESFGPAGPAAPLQQSEAVGQRASPSPSSSAHPAQAKAQFQPPVPSGDITTASAVREARDIQPSAAPIASPAAVPKPALAQPLSRSAKVTLAGSTESFNVEPGQTILDAAEANGVSLPHSCRSGLCGACKMLTVKGRADMPPGHMLSDDEIGEGHVLTCVGRAKADLTLTH